jgi:hypothetical protein
VVLQSVTFHKFVVQAGTDASLVPTEMSTLNATVKLTFRNTGTFFGVHVTAQPVTLNYYQLVLASGDVSSLDLLSPPFPTCYHSVQCRVKFNGFGAYRISNSTILL